MGKNIAAQSFVFVDFNGLPDRLESLGPADVINIYKIMIFKRNSNKKHFNVQKSNRQSEHNAVFLLAPRLAIAAFFLKAIEPKSL